MQAPSLAPKPPVGIVFDCDMGNRIDDVLALALLYGADTKNEARPVSISLTSSSLKAAAFTDAVVRFYVTATMGQFAAFARTLPVGLADDGRLKTEPAYLEAALEKKTPEGKPLFPSTVAKLSDTAECPALIRNALTAQHDGNAIVLCAGPATNLAHLLTLHGAKDLITRKVRYLVMTGGPDMETDTGAAKKVLADWPTDIFVCGPEVGEAFRYPGSSIETDFAWSPSHPVVEAYRAAGKMPYDAPAQALAAALYAVRPKENYFKLSEPDGRQRFLIPDPASLDRGIKAAAELVSAKPVPRRPRFGQQQQQQEQQKKQQEAPKPEGQKPPA
ncbi:MAG TPA: nucleoside hydrolase [Bryobacteraceae bacterium]|nr:nucleoside hydrolase [Bryobacteraceae bacterium]